MLMIISNATSGTLSQTHLINIGFTFSLWVQYFALREQLICYFSVIHTQTYDFVN